MLCSGNQPPGGCGDLVRVQPHITILEALSSYETHSTQHMDPFAKDEGLGQGRPRLDPRPGDREIHKMRFMRFRDHGFTGEEIQFSVNDIFTKRLGASPVLLDWSAPSMLFIAISMISQRKQVSLIALSTGEKKSKIRRRNKLVRRKKS